jgi:16S rRNA (cytidine1402-2'-O)-methyltransferase
LDSNGTLFLVSTPIGNLEDITLRALRVLKEADIVACEDTRTTGMLLKHHGIEAKKLLSYHSHSTNDREDYIVELLLSGNTIALASDAGTPGISDPAYSLVRKALAAGISVSPIPGASALLGALVCSGLPTHHFTYLGFLPVKKGRQTLLQSLKNKEHTVVIYESVHRISKTLEDLEGVFGAEMPVVVGREITKMFEEFSRGSISEVRQRFATKAPRGEFVICI